MTCAACGNDQTILVSTPAGIAEQCSLCNAAIRRKPETQEPAQDGGSELIERVLKASGLDGDKPVPRRRRQDATALRPGATVRAAKRELKQARANIKRLHKELSALEKAEAELSRLLDAAAGAGGTPGGQNRKPKPRS